MKKLALNLDALNVESYATSAAPEADAGTVRAHAFTQYYERTCGQNVSCAVICRTIYDTPCV